MATLTHVRELPRPPAGFFLISIDVTLDGDLLTLWSQPRETARVLHVVSESETTDIALPPFAPVSPYVDLFSDGSVALVGPRCQWRGTADVDQNGLLVDAASGDAIPFVAGDGVNAIGVDADDRLWVAHFDEGVHGGYGWGPPDGPEPIGSGGLNAFDRMGALRWCSATEETAPQIDECCALNVTRSGAFVFFRSEFDLACVQAGFPTRTYSTELEDCRQVAVDGNVAVFDGAFDDPYGTLNVTAFSDVICQPIRKDVLALPNGDAISDGALIARGDAFHYCDGRDWFRWRVEDARV